MLRWLARKLLHPADRRARPRSAPPALPPLDLTTAELARTEPQHRKRLRDADAILNQYERMDGALRLVKR